MTAIHCPVCAAPFQEVLREGILIDICTRCKGIWLDRGELEKLLAAEEGSARSTSPAPAANQPQRQCRTGSADDHERSRLLALFTSAT